LKTVNAHGAAIPALGFGTYELTGDLCSQMVEQALALGYRHLDTATIYKNEESVGEAVANSSVPREAIFLTTKVWPDCYAPENLERSVAGSLEKLQTDYVDLLLLHWPSPDTPLADTIGALNEVCRRGMTRHIGLSNFPTTLLEQAVRLSDLPLVNNQVEYHPFLDQTRVVKASLRHGISLTAYSPLAHGHVLKDALLNQIGETHGKSAIQVCLRWLVQQEGIIAIPRSSNEQHAASNLDIFDFNLSAEEMARIAALTKRNQRFCSPPELAPAWD
jgi:2,5-diketo-D-gluconate reductase B